MKTNKSKKEKELIELREKIQNEIYQIRRETKKYIYGGIIISLMLITLGFFCLTQQDYFMAGFDFIVGSIFFYRAYNNLQDYSDVTIW